MLKNNACLSFSPKKHFSMPAPASKSWSLCRMKIKVSLSPAQNALEAATAECAVSGRWLELVHTTAAYSVHCGADPRLWCTALCWDPALPPLLFDWLLKRFQPVFAEIVPILPPASMLVSACCLGLCAVIHGNQNHTVRELLWVAPGTQSTTRVAETQERSHTN